MDILALIDSDDFPSTQEATLDPPHMLAPDYDLMTSFDDRFAKERPWFEAIVSKFGIRSALDAGCGTGFHSILLSQLGVSVTGVDASPAMIERARENARRLNSAVTLHAGGFSEIFSLTPVPP